MSKEHECVHVEYRSRISCIKSSLDERLILTLYDPKTDVNQTNIDNFVCHVKICPFCGYEVKNDT